MLFSNRFSVGLLLIAGTTAVTKDAAYEEKVVARRLWRYEKVLDKALTYIDQINIANASVLIEECPSHWQYAEKLIERAWTSIDVARDLMSTMNTYNTSRSTGKKVKRAFINSRIYQLFLESKYCGSGPEWTYQGISGPQRWPISFPQCAGKLQTPINLESNSTEFDDIHAKVENNGILPQVSYPNAPGVLHHLGDVIKFVPNKVEGTYVYNDGQYSLLQWHIHTPSEHRINERYFAAEIHFVHTLGNNIAVIGGFVELSNTTSLFLKSMLTAAQNLQVAGDIPFTPVYDDTVKALKSSASFYRYIGSLTTPPCTEGVRWLVAEEPIYTVSPSDLNAMMSKWGFNARDTQPLFHEGDEESHKSREGMAYYNPPVGMSYKPSSNWTYEGESGPERWNLYYPVCKGNIQTPINIDPVSEEFQKIGGVVHNNGLLPHISYPEMHGEIKNKGYTYQFTPDNSHGVGLMYRPDGVFTFAQFHIHLPSEHRVEERDFIGEIHFVHTLDSSLAVLGGFITLSNVTDPFLSSFLQASFPLAKGDHAHFNTSFDEIAKKFQESHTYFKYVGSLTTPPCTEGVRWLIAEEPIFTITPADVKTFMQKIGFNARDTQPFKNEADYDWVSQRKGLEIFNPLVSHEGHEEHVDEAHVLYEGYAGPQFWGMNTEKFEEYDLEYIDGVLHNSGALTRIIYPNTAGVIAHKGDVIKFTPNEITGKYIRPEGAFNLLQWHIHTPSEHRVEGKEFPAEVHFVHSLGNTLAVIGGFVELADYSSDFIAHMIEAIAPLDAHGHADFHPHYDHVAFELSHIEKYFKYTGSLTTPPCTEGVKWLVAEEPLFKISPRDWVLLMSKTGGNSRDTKPLRYPADPLWAAGRQVSAMFNPPISAEASLEWDYNGVKGPEFWSVAYPMCDANLQTPINIQPASHDFIEIQGELQNGGSLPLIFYPNGAGLLENTHGTLKFTPTDANAGKLIRPDGSFSLLQWHIHLPSEHRIDGQDFVGEVHFVHKLGDSLAVLGTFVKLATTSSPILDQMLTAGLNLDHHQSVSWTPDYTNVVNNLKSVSKFYKYTGSLTTPPCTEGVKWMVASSATLDISYQHALAFQSKFGFNARDTKPLKYDADPNWHHNRMAPQFFNPASGTQKPQINSSSFEYNGFKGSAYWQMTEKACGGNIQTPINFMPHHSDSTAIGLVLDNSAHKFPGLIYPGESKAGGKLKNVGDTLKFEPNLLTGAATFTRPDGVYDLLQFHFHSPSEHRVDGMEYPMEFHFVHKMGNNLAVIGGFAQLGATTSDFVLRLLEAGNNLEKGQSVSFIPEYAELVAKFKEIPTYFKYTGSLTTPPCSEGVKWLVAEEPIFTVTWQHWKEFMHKFEFTARDTQPLRYPSNYDWISMRKSDYYSKSDGVTAPTAPTAPTGGTTGGTTGGH